MSEVFPSLNTKFSINAKTCTLKYNQKSTGKTILENGVKYIIPIYQRPYSWTEDQIKKFIDDIFFSYWGNDGNSPQDFIFIGTMQLSERQSKDEQEVIDGQQRLTTFLIILKVLKHKFPQSVELGNIQLNWLHTKVNNGDQQKYLDAFIASDLTFDSETLNPYLKNSFFINEILTEYINSENDKTIIDIDRFTRHLLSNIYFVVIETRAGLSKTLQIFNAINTTGLDLNGGDIFKIRLYEYLKDKKGRDESVFTEISMLYQKISEYNADLKYAATDIRGILSIYQFILIAKYNLPNVLFTYNVDTFFERLFDGLLGVNQWEHYKNNLSNVELSIREIEKIIEARYTWERMDYSSAEDACSIQFLWLSRYSRYWILIFIFIYRFNEEDDYWNKMLLFAKKLSKLYIIYSIRFLRAINDIHTFTYSIVRNLIRDSFEATIHSLNEKIDKLENHKGYGDLENAIAGDITYNSKVKNLICRLSAMLEENYTTTDYDEIQHIEQKLFESSIDVEHIQSYHDSNGDKRKDIWDEWQDDINSIGNLMILEESLNRSIGNKTYEEKKIHYPSSSYSIVKRQVANYDSWSLINCISRKKIELKKIIDYLFENP
jgi:hypothetical protein